MRRGGIPVLRINERLGWKNPDEPRFLSGVTRLERVASWSRTKRSTKLSYTRKTLTNILWQAVCQVVISSALRKLYVCNYKCHPFVVIRASAVS